MRNEGCGCVLHDMQVTEGAGDKPELGERTHRKRQQDHTEPFLLHATVERPVDRATT